MVVGDKEAAIAKAYGDQGTVASQRHNMEGNRLYIQLLRRWDNAVREVQRLDAFDIRHFLRRHVYDQSHAL